MKSSRLVGALTVLAFGIAPHTLAQASLQQDGSIKVQDYAFKARIPDGCTAGWGETPWGHVHGFGFALDKRNCGAVGSNGYVGIWADFNAAFVADALAYDRSCGGTAQWGKGEWQGAIDGLRTVVCRSEDTGGRVELVLTAMAGKWPADMRQPEPMFSYTVRFASTTKRLKEDMKLLRAFVCSIDVIGDGDGSTLCKAKVS